MKFFYLFVFFCLVSVNAQSQQSREIFGTWKPIIVSSEDFYMDAKKDSISLSGKMKNVYSTAVSLQNEKAHLRMNYSKNTFVFEKNKDFYFYLGENLNVPIFKGKYKTEKGNLKLEVINRSNISLEKKATFYFENGLLYLTMHLETNSPVKYVLEKMEKK